MHALINRLAAPTPPDPTIAVIDGRLYAYGDTPTDCWHAFQWQIAGAVGAMHSSLMSRVAYQPVDDDHASEVCEMLAADAVEWLP